MRSPWSPLEPRTEVAKKSLKLRRPPSARAALVLTLSAPLLHAVGCGVEPGQLDTKGLPGGSAQLDAEGSLGALAQESTSTPQPGGGLFNVCVTATGSGEWCGPIPATYRFNVCGPATASRYSYQLSDSCGNYSGGQACVPQLSLDGKVLWSASGYWYSGSITSVTPGPCPASAPSACGVSADIGVNVSSCANPCSEEAPYYWPSNGRCYPCPEGQILQPDGTGGETCQPRCAGLTGEALAACEDCSVDGGVACRCNQFPLHAQALCSCLAFAGGEECYPPPPRCHRHSRR